MSNAHILGKLFVNLNTNLQRIYCYNLLFWSSSITGEDDGCSFHITSDKQRRGGEINCALRLNSVSGTWEIIEHIPKHLRELRDAIHLDQFKNQKELADHLGTDQSTVSRRMSNAIQLGILSNERIKNSYKLAKEKEVEFNEVDF